MLNMIKATIAMLERDEIEIVTEMKKKLEIIGNEPGYQEKAYGYNQAIEDVQAIFQDRYLMLNSMRE